MIHSLEDTAALDPAKVGAKAAWLARGLQAGLPVLEGVVVDVEHSGRYLELGAAKLAEGGSGRARMAITNAALADALHSGLLQSTGGMSAPLVVRSSSTLEGSGLWSGAFTSYLDIRHEEVPKAVVGCYASVFVQATVQRLAAADVSPAKAAMAVLVQPALDPEFGGTARIIGDEVIVVGVKGSPVPLVQGWDPGAQAKVSVEGAVQGDAAVDALGEQLIRDVAGVLRRAQGAIGANSCEWASQDGVIWLLQVQRFATAPAEGRLMATTALENDAAGALGRLIRRFPGPLGEMLVLPWAVGDPSLAQFVPSPEDIDPGEALEAATSQAAALVAEVWGRPKPVAAQLASTALRALRGPEPAPALSQLSALRPPDSQRARGLLCLLTTVRDGLVDAGATAHSDSAWHVDPSSAKRWLAGGSRPEITARIGFDRWEPFNAAVVASNGASITGIGASTGVAFGRMCIVTGPADAAHFRPRDIVVGVHPVPGLAALLFDAAALITTGGGPAAHLFESARALGIPALCATRIEEIIGSELSDATGEWALAVDGTSGTVHALPW